MIFLVLLLFSVTNVSSLANLYDQNINAKISQVRDLMRNRIYPNNSHVHDFVQDDLYFYRWLDESGFSVSQTVQNLMNHLAWRNAEKIDNIELEDWSFFVEEYPQFYNTTDKHGRPVAEVWFAAWNMRRAALTGLGKRLVRWTILHTEITQRRLYQIRKQTGNKNITGAVGLLDVEGFSGWQNACPACMSIFFSISETSEKQYPFLFEDVFMVNVGNIFRELLVRLNKHFGHRKSGHQRIFRNKAEWLPVLDKEFDRDQRSTRFGGTLSRI